MKKFCLYYEDRFMFSTLSEKPLTRDEVLGKALIEFEICPALQCRPYETPIEYKYKLMKSELRTKQGE